MSRTLSRTLSLVQWIRASALVGYAFLALAACAADGSFTRTTVDDTLEDGGGSWTDMELPDGGNKVWSGTKLMYAHSGDELFRIEPTTLQVTSAGKFHPNAPHMNDLAVTPDGKLYSISSNNLYLVDPSDAAISWIAQVPGSVNVALTFDIDGTLLASDKSGNFHRIDPKTGISTNIGAYGAGFGSSGDLVGLKNGALYEVNDVDAKGNNTLITVDPKTGAATVVGPIGFRMVWGLSFWGGTLYGFTRLGEFISIDPKTAKGTLIHTFPCEFWGAAVTPNAPLNLL